MRAMFTTALKEGTQKIAAPLLDHSEQQGRPETNGNEKNFT